MTLPALLQFTLLKTSLVGRASCTLQKISRAMSSKLSPLKCLQHSSDMQLALIVLNSPISEKSKKFHSLWRKAVIKACVDGGTNEVYKMRSEKENGHIPDMITGDFDSVTEEALQYFREKGVSIIETPDQDQTDFTKCLPLVRDELANQNKEVDAYIAFTSNGVDGRLDHCMANIDTLYRARSIITPPLFLMSECSYSYLLSEGEHEIDVNTGHEGDYVGLIPVGGPCYHVTTKGLKWNIDDGKLCFGELVSTSNGIAEGVMTVSVKTDQPLLWTMTVK